MNPEDCVVYMSVPTDKNAPNEEGHRIFADVLIKQMEKFSSKATEYYSQVKIWMSPGSIVYDSATGLSVPSFATHAD